MPVYTDTVSERMGIMRRPGFFFFPLASPFFLTLALLALFVFALSDKRPALPAVP